MQDIKEIFSGSNFYEEPTKLKQISINWLNHSKGIINILKNFCPGYELTENHKVILKDLLLYFTGNKSLVFKNESETRLIHTDLDLNKGILLVGGIGTGKSLIMKAFKFYTCDILQRNSFRCFTSLECISGVETEGNKYLSQFGAENKDCFPAYFDDIASTNENVNHYGTRFDVMEKIMQIRYIAFSRLGKLTHATSNIYPKDMIKIYDNRTIDRMKEMFNIIELNGKSFRK